jgi:hypothetical protein
MSVSEKCLEALKTIEVVSVYKYRNFDGNLAV